MTGTSYQRKVLYFQEYCNEEPHADAGFCRIETKKDKCKITLYVSRKIVCQSTWKAIFLYKDEDEYRIEELGELVEGRENWGLSTTIQLAIMDKAVMVLVMDDKKHYISHQLLPKDFQFFDETKKEKMGNIQEVAQVKAAEKEPWIDELFTKLPSLYPFEDDEMIRCARLEPKDFGFLPAEYWTMAKNSFMLEGYYTHRHLLLSETETCLYLGVPGVYHRKDCFLANMFGFSYFKGIHDKEEEMGDYGYWFHKLKEG